MATVPNPKTWAPGTVPTASEFNTDIRDVINFLKAPQRVLVSNNADVDLTTQTWHLLTWNSEVTDTEGIHSTASNTSRLTAVTPGWYSAWCAVRWEVNSSNGSRQIQIREGSAGSESGGTMVALDIRHTQDNVLVNGSTQHCMGMVQLGVGDYVEAFVWHDYDGSLSDNVEIDHISGGGATTVRFGMTWIAK